MTVESPNNQVAMNRRLRAAAEFVRLGSRVADIGCDHGYLSAYLALNGISGEITAVDVNRAPLDCAERLVSELDLGDKIKVVLSNGLSSLRPCESEDIVIAGMGGDLIASLIREAEVLQREKLLQTNDREPYRKIRLILQPMTFPERVRIALYNSGFEILSEKCVSCRGRLYVIICAEFSGITTMIDEFFALFGKITENTDEDSKNYIIEEYEKIQKVLKNIENIKSKNINNHKIEYYKRISLKTKDIIEKF